MASLRRVILVETDKVAKKALSRSLRMASSRNRLSLLSSPHEALSWFAAGRKTDIAYIAHELPGVDGLELAARLNKLAPECLLILVTGAKEIPLNVSGASFIFDIVQKPISPMSLEIGVERAMRRLTETERIQKMRDFFLMERSPRELPDVSAAIKAHRRQIEEMAQIEDHIVIRGEDGSGKSYAAKSVYLKSVRRDGPFLIHACDTTATDEQDGVELFGKETTRRDGTKEIIQGKLEMGGAGLLVLEAIASLSPILRMKLLRAMQEGSFERIGGEDPVPLTVRVIATENDERTHKGNKNAKRFMTDLEKLAGCRRIDTVPLRERKEDVEGLVYFFINQSCAQRNIHQPTINGRVIDLLRNYQWPGNIEELRNIIDMAVALSGDKRIEPDYLAPRIHVSAAGVDISHLSLHNDGRFRRTHDIFSNSALDREKIIASLQKYNWQKSKTAQYLGLTLSQLIYRIKKLGITREESSPIETPTIGTEKPVHFE